MNNRPYDKLVRISNRLYNDGLEKAKVRDLTGRFTEKRERVRVSIKDKLRENTEKVKARDESQEPIRRKPEVIR